MNPNQPGEETPPQHQGGWEEQFDGVRNDGEHASIDDMALHPFDVVMLKDIIRSLLTQQEERVRENVERELEKRTALVEISLSEMALEMSLYYERGESIDSVGLLKRIRRKFDGVKSDAERRLSLLTPKDKDV